jgi:hypothetical protein
MDDAGAELDLAESFVRAGRTWVELDDKGRVVERGAPAQPRAAKKPGAKKVAAAKTSSSGAKPKTGKTKVRAAG